MLVTLSAEHWPLSLSQHTNLTDDHDFWEIVNWKWVATDSVDFSFLCSSLQTSDPTHASECREEARTRMADKGDVGISDTRTQHTVFTDCHNPPTVRSACPFLALRWHKSAGSHDTLKRSLQGLNHGERNSQALDKVNVNLDQKNVSRYYRLLSRQQLNGTPGWLRLSDSCHNENAPVERGAGNLSALLECVALRLLLCVNV